MHTSEGTARSSESEALDSISLLLHSVALVQDGMRLGVNGAMDANPNIGSHQLTCGALHYLLL